MIIEVHKGGVFDNLSLLMTVQLYSFVATAASEIVTVKTPQSARSKSNCGTSKHADRVDPFLFKSRYHQ